jgi:hypothetical protein
MRMSTRFSSSRWIIVCVGINGVYSSSPKKPLTIRRQQEESGIGWGNDYSVYLIWLPLLVDCNFLQIKLAE